MTFVNIPDSGTGTMGDVSIALSKFVSTNGNDSTGTGSLTEPYATITAALNSITDASPTKRYVIRVAAGSYTEASLVLKANVFVIGESKESVRITGAVSMAPDFTGTADNRSGFSMVSLLSAANFNWQTVTSGAGKIYANEVVFGSTVNMYGYNNAIAQAQFDSCIFFGAITISGVNVGVFTNNVCFSNITLNQHPNTNMPTLFVATGGYCSGTITQTTTVNSFGRRCASFLRSFSSENLIVDGPSSYSDFCIDSGSKNGAQNPNGGNLVPNNAVISQELKPNETNAHNMGDWGKQWFWSFAYVHASSGTDCYLISYPEVYAPDSTGKSIGIYTDGAGLQSNVDGGEITLETATTAGTGVRGRIILNGRYIDASSNQIKNVADATNPQDAVTKAQLDGIVNPKKTNVTLTNTDITNQYINLAYKAKDQSVHVSIDRMMLYEGEDYSLSVVGGVTRVSFIGTVASGGPEALIAGDKLHINYLV